MAVQAVFQADFTSFDTGVQKADAELKKFEGTSKTTETSLQRMTTTAASGAAPAQSLTSAYRQFDGVLASVGVNIGPQVKGLEDLAAAAGKASGTIGAMGTAGLALGAAFAIWETYKWADRFFETNKAITESIALMIGYRSATSEAAAAINDTLVRATANAGREITNYTEAIKINQEAMKKRIDAGREWTTTLSDAQREVRALSEATIRDIEIAQRAGASVEQLTAKYGISALGLKELAERKKVSADQASNHAAALEKEAAAAAKVDAEYAKLMSDLKNAEGLRKMEQDRLDLLTPAANALRNAYGQLAKQQAAAKVEAAALAEQTKALEADYQLTIKAVEDQAAAHTEAGAAATAATSATVAGYAQVGQQVALTMDNVRALIVLNQYSAAANAALMQHSSLFPTTASYAAVARIPMPGAAGGGVQMSNTFNLVDTESNIARRVSEEIMRTVRAGTQLT